VITVEGSILALLAQHESLAYEQIAAELEEQPERVWAALHNLRERGLVEAIPVGRLEGQLTTAVSYWRLTSEGRSRTARGD
jgi:predicted ArsR family transcriptional regulator